MVKLCWKVCNRSSQDRYCEKIGLKFSIFYTVNFNSKPNKLRKKSYFVIIKTNITNSSVNLLKTNFSKAKDIKTIAPKQLQLLRKDLIYQIRQIKKNEGHKLKLGN